MVEAINSTAAPGQETSYSFSEQIDPKTGTPVGLVPLELVYRKHPEFFSFAPGFKYHDVGIGRAGSTNFFLDKLPPEVCKSLTLVTSEPYPEERFARTREELGGRVASYFFLEELANVAVRNERDCDLITLINMIHLVPETERIELIRDTYDSLKPGGRLIISTTFIEEWSPGEEVTTLMNRLTKSVLTEAKRNGVNIRELLNRLKHESLVMWSTEEYLRRIKEAGFEIEFPASSSELVTMPCTAQSYFFISEDYDWLRHTLPGVEHGLAIDITRGALGLVLQEKGLDYSHPLSRNTLVVVAQKPA